MRFHRCTVPCLNKGDRDLFGQDDLQRAGIGGEPEDELRASMRVTPLPREDESGLG